MTVNIPDAPPSAVTSDLPQHLRTYKALASDETQGRIVMAAFKMAQDVINESTENNPYWEPRREFARMVLRNPVGYKKEFVLRVLRNPTVVATARDDGSLAATDSDLEFVVSANWMMLCGELGFISSNQPGGVLIPTQDGRALVDPITGKIYS